MAAYVLNTNTCTVHKSSCRYLGRTNIENKKDFYNLDEILRASDKPVTRCKSCMSEEIKLWNEIFGIGTQDVDD